LLSATALSLEAMHGNPHSDAKIRDSLIASVQVQADVERAAGDGPAAPLRPGLN
jgi:hypothetical protein